jgi:predicted transposase YbfD/YdcC
VSVTITEHFSKITDPRKHTRKNDHKLGDIFVIAICGIICGADTWTAVATYGLAKKDWLNTFLELPNGIPSHDTFSRIFGLIDPKEFQECFASWIRAVSKLTEGEIASIDGKTLRRSYDTSSSKPAIHMVSAWANNCGLVLSQLKTEEKSNEITAIPKLLTMLDLQGCIVTIDAMGCQKKITEKIASQEGDYVIALKGNQGSLFQSVKNTLEHNSLSSNESDFDFYQTEDIGHGRHEIRSYLTTDNLDKVPMASDWPGLKTVGVAVSKVTKNKKTTRELRFYISSIKNDAKLFAKSVRSHWGIENSLHWVLDVAFREDESRVRKNHGPENMATMRHIALNLLKQDKTAKIGVNGKRLKAGWDNDYLANILSGL